MHGQFSTKTDVYSFGVILLELLSGQRNSSFQVGKNAEDLASYVSIFYKCYVQFFLLHNHVGVLFIRHGRVGGRKVSKTL